MQMALAQASNARQEILRKQEVCTYFKTEVKTKKMQMQIAGQKSEFTQYVELYT